MYHGERIYFSPTIFRTTLIRYSRNFLIFTPVYLSTPRSSSQKGGGKIPVKIFETKFVDRSYETRRVGDLFGENSAIKFYGTERNDFQPRYSRNRKLRVFVRLFISVAAKYCIVISKNARKKSEAKHSIG